MSFWKPLLRQVDGKWYLTSVVVGKPVETNEVADQLAAISTVSRGDVANVLDNLAPVLAEFLKNGRSVKLDGLGTFYYVAKAEGNGKATADEVSVEDISAVRVRFIPEVERNASNTHTTRALVPENIPWVRWYGPGEADPESPGTGGGGDDTDPV